MKPGFINMTQRWKFSQSSGNPEANLLPKKAKMTRSAVKVILTVFWDTEGTIMCDFLPTNKTMNGEYYSQLLLKLKQELVTKRPGKLRKGVFLLQDNAPSHRSAVSTATADKCAFEILPHPAYSPDIAPSDFFLFPALKKDLKGRRFDDEDEVCNAAMEWFNAKPNTFYFEGLFKVKGRWDKCVTLCGDNVEK